MLCVGESEEEKEYQEWHWGEYKTRENAMGAQRACPGLCTNGFTRPIRPPKKQRPEPWLCHPAPTQPVSAPP
jgi:hypothetical protein